MQGAYVDPSSLSSLGHRSQWEDGRVDLVTTTYTLQVSLKKMYPKGPRFFRPLVKTKSFVLVKNIVLLTFLAMAFLYTPKKKGAYLHEYVA